MGRATGHFERQRAIVKGGWLQILTRSEIIMLNIYEQHADADGVSFPSGKVIAEIIGHKNTNHIGRVRDKLASRGLLSIIESGGGRHRQCKVQLLTPPPLATSQKHSQTERGNTPKIEQKHSQTERGNTPKIEQKHSQTEHLHNKEEQLLTAKLTASNSAGETGEAGIEDEAGVLAILEVGESDPKAAIRRLHDAGHLTGWELSGLSEGMSSAELRFLLAKYFLNLRAMGKEPTRISWRSRIGEISRMDPGEAAERLRNTIANNYVGLARASPKSREETPDEFARRIISSREQNQ